MKTKEPIRPGRDVREYSEIYGSYCELDRRLSGFFARAYSGEN